jgi:hypothetical protein
VTFKIYYAAHAPIIFFDHKGLHLFWFQRLRLDQLYVPLTHTHWQNANEQTPLPLYVPEDCRTLNEAVKRVGQDPRIKTIVLGQGEHQVDGDYLEIFCAMRIWSTG